MTELAKRVFGKTDFMSLVDNCTCYSPSADNTRCVTTIKELKGNRTVPVRVTSYAKASTQ